jgi:hypothetical protein
MKKSIIKNTRDYVIIDNSCTFACIHIVKTPKLANYHEEQGEYLCIECMIQRLENPDVKIDIVVVPRSIFE